MVIPTDGLAQPSRRIDMIKGKCGHCGKTFRTEYATKKYCNRGCKEKAKEKRKYDKLRGGAFTTKTLWARECGVCGNEFLTTHKIGKYCSDECRKGSSPYKKHALHRRKINNSKCEACGFNNEYAMHAHHLNRGKGLGLVVLCANCHYIFHGVAGQKPSQYERDTKQEVIDIINQTKASIV